MTRNIYLISAQIGDEKHYKIGYTKRKVETRLKELKTGNPATFNIEKVYVADQYGASIESRLHDRFKFKKVEGEWFLLEKEDIDNFENYCEQYYENFELLKENTWIQDRNIKFK